MINKSFIKLVSFRVGDEYFVVFIENVQEVIRFSEIVKIPKSPDFIEGIINLRGKVIPVIDLKKRLALESKGFYPKTTRIIIVNILGIKVGIKVDAVDAVLNIDVSNFEEVPSAITSINQKFIKGILKHQDKMMIALDVDKLLDSSEMDILSKV